MKPVTGLHHVTAIAGPAQENLDFYNGVLGMRLVKRSVNQDDPGTYHLFYADAAGHPGTDLTFFPWPDLAPPRRGHGLGVEVALTVPPGNLAWWGERLERHGARPGTIETRFGDRALPFEDPHGMAVALVEAPVSAPAGFAAWPAGPVPPERQVRALHCARLLLRDPGPTARFLEDVLGFAPLAEDGGWRRFAFAGGGPGRMLDLRAAPELPRGAWGTGCIHHLAWRVDDAAHQRDLRAGVEAAGRRPTAVIDRFWFQSVYFLEPGGVLFELATDGPGFAVDEDPAHLGETLVLPPWLEPGRALIAARLPELHEPPRG